MFAFLKNHSRSISKNIIRLKSRWRDEKERINAKWECMKRLWGEAKIVKIKLEKSKTRRNENNSPRKRSIALK